MALYVDLLELIKSLGIAQQSTVVLFFVYNSGFILILLLQLYYSTLNNKWYIKLSIIVYVPFKSVEYS